MPDDYSPVVEQGELEVASGLSRLRRRQQLAPVGAGFRRVLLDENGEPLHGDNATPGERRNTPARNWVRVDVGHHRLEYRVGFSDPSGHAGFVATIAVEAAVVDAVEMVRYGTSSVKDVLEPALQRTVVDANGSGKALTDDGRIGRLTKMRQLARASTRKLEHKTLDALPSWLSATVQSTSVDFDDTTQRHYRELVELDQQGDVIDARSKNDERLTLGQINVRNLWREDLMPHLSSPSQRVFEQVYANPTDQNIAAAVHQANERELALLQEVVRSFEMAAKEGFVEKEDPAIQALLRLVERLPHMVSASEPALPQGARQDVVDAAPTPEDQAGDRDFKD